MLLPRFLDLFNKVNSISESNTFKRSEVPGPTCPIDIPLTCHNKTVEQDSCCFEYPGGIFLQSQFWNYMPSKSNFNESQIVNELGPLDKFTIHGLWPDNCDGTFEQFCDKDLEIDDVDYLLKSDQFNTGDLEISGKDLLSKLDALWKSNNNNAEALWIHEYNKHGTCIKTLRPICYSNAMQESSKKVSSDKSSSSSSKNNQKYLAKQSVYDYFRITYNLYSSLDTFAMLKKQSIIPDKDASYTLAQIQNALSKGFNNSDVYVGCDKNNAINEIWYFNLLKGSILGEEFIPIDSLKTKSNCKSTNVKFYPKGYIPSNSAPGRTSINGKITIDGYDGFLISNGHWYNNKQKGVSSPATYQLIESDYGSYVLKTSSGYCYLNNDNEFKCNKKKIKSASQFEWDEDQGYIGYSNKFSWGSTDYPKGNKQSKVYLGLDYKYDYKLKFTKN